MIDTYFKEYFWTAHLIVLALAGLLVANAANAFIAEAVRPEPGSGPVKGGTKQAASDPDKSTVPTGAFLERNIFQAEREDLTPVEVPEEDTGDSHEPASLDNCEPSAMRMTLVGTEVVVSAPDRSIAVFVDGGKNAAEAYHIGDELQDAKILAIEWRRVAVDRAGRCEYFSLEAEQEAAKSARPGEMLASAPPAPDGGDKAPGTNLGEGVKQVSDKEYEIPRGEIDNVLGNLSVVATQARIVPSFQNGKPNGFKLFSIRPGSLYSKIGIQNGDIVQKINGYEIDSPDKALEIYSKLKDANAITVDLVRRGRQQTMTYQIR